MFYLVHRVIADVSVVQPVRDDERTGQDMYAAFVEVRFIKREKKVFDSIKKNSITLFRTPITTVAQQEKSNLNLLKNDFSFFSRLYKSCQTRRGNVQEFFKHKNQRFPPSLSQNGSIRVVNKFVPLTKCLEPLSVVPEKTLSVEAVVVYGADLVYMLRPGTNKTFDEYAPIVFLPYICRQLELVNRINVVWDVFIANNLKDALRGKSGRGIRLWV